MNSSIGALIPENTIPNGFRKEESVIVIRSLPICMYIKRMTVLLNNDSHIVNDMLNVDARENYKCFKSEGFQKLLQYFRKLRREAEISSSCKDCHKGLLIRLEVEDNRCMDLVIKVQI
jgi:hypothetical protein